MFGENWNSEKDHPYTTNYKPMLSHKIFGVEPEWCHLRTDKADGSEIAKVLGISDAAVSTHLRRAIKKIYLILWNEGNSPYETFILMSEILSVCFDCQEEVNRFWALLPSIAKEMIRDEARQKYKNSFVC